MSENPPRSVDRAFNLFAVALFAGITEAVLRAIGEIDRGETGLGSVASGLGIRMLVYLVVAAVMLAMRDGHRWARATLALGLGIVGLASLLMEPAAVMLSGNGVEVTSESVVLGIVRTIHVSAVVAAVWCMYRRDSRSYFRMRALHPA